MELIEEDQLISRLLSFKKLYIITAYQSFTLLFMNFGCVVNLTQSYLTTFLRVS